MKVTEKHVHWFQVSLGGACRCGLEAPTHGPEVTRFPNGAAIIWDRRSVDGIRYGKRVTA